MRNLKKIDVKGNPWKKLTKKWIDFNDSGKNIHRDFLNLPRFIERLPDLNLNMIGLEIGCGEGILSRLISSKVRTIIASDFSQSMINYAKLLGKNNFDNIIYQVENAEDLTFKNCSFDFVLAFMCLMDMSNPYKAISEAYRVLKPDGFFQISLYHPCFGTPSHRNHVVNNNGKKIAIEVGNYTNEGMFDIEWLEGDLKGVKTFHNHKMLSTWLMDAISVGFQLEFIEEPYADKEIVRKCPHLEHTITIPDNMIIRFRKK